MGPTCETCRFWKPYDSWKDEGGDEVLVGECRRYPPVANLYDKGGDVTEQRRFVMARGNGTFVAAVYPHTESCDWCGEWDARLPEGPGE